MLLRQLRRMAAGLAAVAVMFAAPSQSKADVQILVEEFVGDTTIGSSAFSVGTPNTPFFSQPFSYTAAGGHFTISSGGGGTTTNSAQGSLRASLSTSLNIGITDLYSADAGHKLRITVTDDRFVGGSTASMLTNGVAIPLDLPDGVIEAAAFSRIYDPRTAAEVTQASNTLALAGYITPNPGQDPPAAPNLARTGIAIDEQPRVGADESITRVSVTGLPSPYAIQQVIVVSVEGPDSMRGQTFTVNSTARVDPVPAPGGLALALIGLPLLGLRRALRKRAA